MGNMKSQKKIVCHIPNVDYNLYTCTCIRIRDYR